MLTQPPSLVKESNHMPPFAIIVTRQTRVRKKPKKIKNQGNEFLFILSMLSILLIY